LNEKADERKTQEQSVVVVEKVEIVDKLLDSLESCEVVKVAGVEDQNRQDNVKHFEIYVFFVMEKFTNDFFSVDEPHPIFYN
jgi:hypothetical protein